VAVIKPSMADGPLMFRVLPGGQVDLQGVSAENADCLCLELRVRDDQRYDRGRTEISGSARFDIKAKASIGTSTGPTVAPPIDIDDLRLMLRALLADRFKLATHTEDRPVTAYNLVAVKPKLKPADPTNRTSLKKAREPTEKDPRNTNPTLSRLVTFQNMTMAQFADLLQKIAPGYIHSRCWTLPASKAPGILLSVSADPTCYKAPPPVVETPASSLPWRAHRIRPQRRRVDF